MPLLHYCGGRVGCAPTCAVVLCPGGGSGCDWAGRSTRRGKHRLATTGFRQLIPSEPWQVSTLCGRSPQSAASCLRHSGGCTGQGRRAPSHSMSSGPGCARSSPLTSVGGGPPPLACRRCGVRCRKTNTATAVAWRGPGGVRPANTGVSAGRGQWVPFPVSKGGGAGEARSGGHGGEGDPLASARATVVRLRHVRTNVRNEPAAGAADRQFAGIPIAIESARRRQ
jgi:hypothetical protein